MSKEYLEYRELWERYPKECYVSQFPLHLDIELTNRCNLQCSMCMFHSKDAPFKPKEPCDMDFDVYKKIIDEGSKKGLRAIKLNYRGEPLLYAQLPEAIKYAKDKGILDVQINTNATLLTKEMCKKLIIAGLDLLIISDYNIVLQVINTTYLHKIREIHGRENPKIRIQTKRSQRWKGIVDEIVEPIYYDYHHIKEVFDRSNFKCVYPFLRFLVLADGSVFSCSCGTVLVEKFLGNVKHWNLEDLWHKQEMKFLRMCHENRNSELARICRMCPMHNDYIRRQKESV